MTHFPFDIVGFDLDGTLLDTSPDLAGAVNHALALLGRAPLALERVRPMIGHGARHMLDRALAATGGSDAATLERLYPELLAYYGTHIAHGTTPYPGVIDALDALAARGVTLAIVTNKLERLAVKLVAEFGLTDRFATILGGDSVAAAKPSPIPIEAMIARCGGGRAAFVGDSILDVEAAQEAGIPVIAVAFDVPIAEAEEFGADAVIDHYDDLVATLERLV